MKIMIPSEKAKILDENLEFNKENNALVVGNNLEVDGFVQQNSANYELDLRNSLIASDNYSLYFHSDSWYCAFKVINGVLWFIMSGNAVTKERANEYKTFNVAIPESFKNRYYDKIYRADGTTLNKQGIIGTYNENIGGDIFYSERSGYGATNAYCVIKSSRVANDDILIEFRNLGATTDNGVLFLDVRIPLLII